MSDKEKLVFTNESLHLEDNCPETHYIVNNLEEFQEHGSGYILAAPKCVISRLAAANLFDSSTEFENDPTKFRHLDQKFLEMIATRATIMLEGVVKAFHRHGPEAKLMTDQVIATVERATDKQVDERQLTAVENLLQAAIIGMWFQQVANIQSRGDDARLHSLNKLMRELGMSEVPNKEEMPNFINALHEAGTKFTTFLKAHSEELRIKDVFPKERMFFKALTRHLDDEEDFMIAFERYARKNLEDLEKVDLDIFLNKATDLWRPMLKIMDENPILAN
mgnify:FL=1